MMKGHFTPRKKRIHSPSVVGAMKLVRIDHQTEIMVSATIPDEEARERYMERKNRSLRDKFIPVTPNYPIKPEFKEEEIGADEIAVLVDEENAAELPDDE